MALFGGSVRCLSRGVSADVFELRRGREAVALKVLHPREEGVEARRFAREVEALARLRHPNVVRVTRVLADAHGPRALVMPLLRGETLAQRIARRGPLDADEAARRFVELLDGLAALHRLAIIHRDVKPGNVFIGREQTEPPEADRAILLDLGAIKTSAPGLTGERAFVGTARYAAPEQILEGRVDARTDVFGAGLTMAEALTCASGRTTADPTEALDEAPLQRLAGRIPDRRLGRVAARAIRICPRDRFPDVEAMSVAIEGGAS